MTELKTRREPPYSLRLSTEERAFLRDRAGRASLGTYIKSVLFSDAETAKPRVPPPRYAQTVHPQLAPPGMSGIKTSQRFALARAEPPQPKPYIQLGQLGEAKRAFKSLVRTPPSKFQTRDR